VPTLGYTAVRMSGLRGVAWSLLGLSCFVYGVLGACLALVSNTWLPFWDLACALWLFVTISIAVPEWIIAAPGDEYLFRER
jgi:hypothetical protein